MAIDILRQDLRYAFRSLLRAPGFASVTILTLALGIGANTAIFSILNGVLLRPLGYPKPAQLMFLSTRFPNMGFEQFWVSPPEFFEFRELNRSFAAVGAFTTGEANVTAEDRPLRVRSASVTDELIRVLGVQPVAGRLFAKGETDAVGPPPAPGGPSPQPPQIAILSHELWQSAFGGQPIVGRTVEINGVKREVIGVLPPGADVMDNRTQIWLPLGLNPANRRNRGNHYLYLIGRLKDGVSEQQAKTELTALIQNWGERVGVKQHVFAPLPPPGAPNAAGAGAGHVLQMKPVQEEIVGSASRTIWVLQAAVGFVLLIACANLASLLLARAETRHREFAVRTALGAGRGRLLRQFITEGVLLAVTGGASGLVLARVGVKALIRWYPTSLPRTNEVVVDSVVLLFTLGVSVATGIVFGLAPLTHTPVKGLAVALKEGARGASGAARHHVRRGLVMAEVAMAVMLVIGAALLLRTVYNLANVDAGFDRSRLVTFSMSLPTANYRQAPDRAQLYQRLLERLRQVPGVQSASAMTGLPPNRAVNANDTEIDNYTAPPEGPFENVDYYQNVMTDYFETMGIPIVQGRGFVPTDAAATGMVAVVNETLVRTFWRDRNPIGQRLRPCCGDEIPWFTVVGVAKDVKQGGVDQKTGTEFYFLVDQTANAAGAIANAPATMNIVLRTTLPPSTLASTIEAVVRQADASVPVVRLRDMNDVFAESIRQPRLLTQLLGALAGLALLLAAIGTYGLLSHMVTERRREIGIRMALGADQGSVVGLVMRQGLLVTTAGLVAGLAGALALSRLIASLLFGVQPTDPATFAEVVVTIGLVAALACWLPAWRASRVDPTVVLRDE
jgi:putative ABC transport system permease protein